MNGVQGGNEFTIDGAANVSNARGVGFSPPSDAIEQFKVQTNAFDAQAGHTAGAVVNFAIKSGTNAVHGAGSFFNRDGSRTSTPLLGEPQEFSSPQCAAGDAGRPRESVGEFPRRGTQERHASIDD